MGYGPDDLDHLDYLSFPALTDLNTEAGALRLMAAVAVYGSEIVVIDTSSAPSRVRRTATTPGWTSTATPAYD